MPVIHILTTENEYIELPVIIDSSVEILIKMSLRTIPSVSLRVNSGSVAISVLSEKRLLAEGRTRPLVGFVAEFTLSIANVFPA